MAESLPSDMEGRASPSISSEDVVPIQAAELASDIDKRSERWGSVGEEGDTEVPKTSRSVAKQFKLAGSSLLLLQKSSLTSICYRSPNGSQRSKTTVI